MRRLFRWPGSSADVGRDVGSELRFHLDMRTQELIDAGMGPQAARLAALRAFGDLDAIAGECRTIAARGARERARRAIMTGLLHDLRFAFRSLRKSPGFTLVSVLTLALGIGANTAVFSMIRGVLLRPLPYADGERLVYLRQPAPLAGVQNAQFSVLELADYRERGQPGVIATASSLTFPLDGHRRINVGFRIEGQPPAEEGAEPLGDLRSATPEYFRTLGIPLVTGRFFAPSDGPNTPDVAVVNQTLARRFWGGETAVGHRISADSGESWITIVGVVGDVRHYGLDGDPSDEVYLPFSQLPIREGTFLVRTSADPAAMARRIGVEVLSIDAGQPRANVQTLEEVRGEALASPRLTTTLLMLFALLALCITAAGLGGVVAFSVSQRTQEIGIRMALGAGRGEVLGMVLREGLGLVGLGLALGIAAAVLLTRLMTGLLFQVKATDPITFVGMSLILVLIAAAACFAPARRATTVDPMVALRAS